MIVKHVADHVLKKTVFCGQLSEVLRHGEYEPLDLAIIEGVSSTVGHFHRGFDEVYFELDGAITVEFYDPERGRQWREELKRGELCVIPKGLHHKIVAGSEGNRMCCICVPHFDPGDETRSERLEQLAGDNLGIEGQTPGRGGTPSH